MDMSIPLVSILSIRSSALDIRAEGLPYNSANELSALIYDSRFDDIPGGKMWVCESIITPGLYHKLKEGSGLIQAAPLILSGMKFRWK
jgi:hypothetical protein